MQPHLEPPTSRHPPMHTPSPRAFVSWESESAFHWILPSCSSAATHTCGQQHRRSDRSSLRCKTCQTTEGPQAAPGARKRRAPLQRRGVAAVTA